MNRKHFLVLYRQFLFRIVDLESLSPHARGDASRLLGQFAALLISVSISLTMPALLSGSRPDDMPEAAAFVATMIGQHFLIATTMLVVGLFAVLSWDGTFPDSRDVFVLLPLPVRPRTILAAKVSAIATALALTVILLHSMLGLVWPFLFAKDAHPVALPALAFDPTPKAMDVGTLKPALDLALADALSNGSLKEGTGAGLAIGVFKQGERRVWTYGAAMPDALFDIGSITKTFTGLILARMAAEGRVRLDEPVRQLLPPGIAPVSTGDEITLADLATHHSGLPAMPDNFLPADRADPYADYNVSKLYDYVRRRGLVKPEDTLYRYSNLGLALLGQALAERAKVPYSSLVREQISEPLSLHDTGFALTAAQRSRLLHGYDDRHRPVHEWNFDAFVGAGGLRSSAADMLRYLEANLHPEQYPALAGALMTTQRVLQHGGAGAQIGLAWTYHPETGAYRHGGATAGFTSHVFFIPRLDCAAVVLMNSGPNLVFSPDLIAEHIRQRLSGEPAVALRTVVVPATMGLVGVLRSYAAYWFTMSAAALFVYGLILGFQGLLAWMLPRRLFLRISGYVQMFAFSLALLFFFVQPGLGGLDDLTARQTWRLVECMPSFWFLALYEFLNGNMHPALARLMERAWIGLLVAVIGSAAAYSLSYARTLSRIVDEPEIPLAPVRWRWLPEFGSRFQTAIARFTIRSFVRSKQHRLTVAFYLGIGVAFTSLLLKDPSTKRALADSAAGNPWKDASVALWAASMVLLTLAVVGVRVVFALPVDLRANWLFQVTGTRSGAETLSSARLPLLLIAVVPVWIVCACFCIGLWPSLQSVEHIVALGFMGLIVGELCLIGFRKIPFACSYLPGKSRMHIVFVGAFGLLLGAVRLALLERGVFKEVKTAAGWTALLILLWLVARVATWKLAGMDSRTQFEETQEGVVQGLGLGSNA